MNNEIWFDVDFNVLWHGDAMEVTANVANNLSGRIESEIAQHFEADLSDLREYIRLKQEGGEIAAVVRCRDCKWFGNSDCAILIVDDSDKPGEDDFCSFASRR